MLFYRPALLLSLFIGHLGWLRALSLLAALVRNDYFHLRLSHWIWRKPGLTQPPSRTGDVVQAFRSGVESLPDAGPC